MKFTESIVIIDTRTVCRISRMPLTEYIYIVERECTTHTSHIIYYNILHTIMYYYDFKNAKIL